MSKEAVGLQYPSDINSWSGLALWMKNVYDNLFLLRNQSVQVISQSSRQTVVAPVKAGIKKVYTDTQLDSAYVVILADATDGPITLGLPPVGQARNVTYVVKKIDVSANAVTLDGRGFTIDGAATQALLAQYDVYSAISDGSEWFSV